MPITNQDERYLRNKHKGGKNNSKGATYESYYATYQIVSFMHQYMTQLESVFLSSQLEGTFVDDLLIEEPNSHRTYHQLKDVAGLRWTTGKGRSLNSDFKKQMEISKEKCETFKLKLVYSDVDSTVSSVPSDLQPSTSSEYFPACVSINQLMLSYPPFQNAVRLIMAKNDAEEDELNGAASAILGAWSSVEQKNVSLQQISKIVYSISKGYVNIKTYPTVRVSEECKEILRKFNLSFHENGLMVYWSYENINGKVVWTEEVEKRLQESSPIDIWSLIKVLS